MPKSTGETPEGQTPEGQTSRLISNNQFQLQVQAINDLRTLFEKMNNSIVYVNGGEKEKVCINFQWITEEKGKILLEKREKMCDKNSLEGHKEIVKKYKLKEILIPQIIIKIFGEGYYEFLNYTTKNGELSPLHFKKDDIDYYLIAYYKYVEDKNTGNKIKKRVSYYRIGTDLSFYISKNKKIPVK